MAMRFASGRDAIRDELISRGLWVIVEPFLAGDDSIWLESWSHKPCGMSRGFTLRVSGSRHVAGVGRAALDLAVKVEGIPGPPEPKGWPEGDVSWFDPAT